MKTDPALWAAIQAHDIDVPGAALPFSRRLARDNGWKQPFADQAIAEYRRFAYLACVSPHMVTPSEEVDAVWHLHLIYTRDYWERFCGEVLKRPLHHNPTEGGPEQGARFDGAYRATLDLYRHEVGEAPPQAFWPIPEVRFAPVTKRFKLFDLPKQRVLLCLAVAGAVLAGCKMAPVIGELKAHPLLTLMFAFVAIMVVARMFTKPRHGQRRGDNSGGCGTGGGCGSSNDGGDGGSGCGSSGCGGGCGGD